MQLEELSELDEGGMEADEKNVDTGGYDWPRKCFSPHLDASTQGIVWAFRH